MPTLFARPYVRRIADVGKTEKVLGVLILLLVAAAVVAFVVQVATSKEYLFDIAAETYAPPTAKPTGAEALGTPATTFDAENPFPDPALAGWSAPGRVDRFDADNLYIEIDGRAAAYLQHGCVGLTVGTYQHETDADRAIDVYWYDMATPENALAMYRSEEPPEAPPILIGRAGYQVGGAVFFCKGPSYVQVIPRGLGDDDGQAALKIAQRVVSQMERE